MNTLFRVPPPVPVTATMTKDQRTAWTLITSTVGGCFPEEIGHKVHGHLEDGYCDWCGARGTQLVRSAALKPLLVRRRASGKVEAREQRYRAVEASGQLAELPVDLFGDAA